MKYPVKMPIIFAFFSFVWILPLINDNTASYMWLFVFFFTASVISFMLIKNMHISFFTALFLAAVPIVFNLKNLLFVLPSVAVIFYYIFLQKKASVLKETVAKKIKMKGRNPKISFSDTDITKTSPTVFAGAVLSVIFGTGILIYLFINKPSGINMSFNQKYQLNHLILSGLLFVFCALAAVCIIRKAVPAQTVYEKGFTATSIRELKSLYIASLICLIQTVFNFYMSNILFTNGYERMFFFPWFVYFLLTVYYEDPVYCSLVKYTSKAFDAFSN